VKSRAKQEAHAIMELRHKYDLNLLLNHMNMARGSYYYYDKTDQLTDKYEAVKNLIKQITRSIKVDTVIVALYLY
jgi:hypothetical protein